MNPEASLPWHANVIDACRIEDTDGNRVAECKSPQIAAFIIQQANAYHRVSERGEAAADAYQGPAPIVPEHNRRALI